MRKRRRMGGGRKWEGTGVPWMIRVGMGKAWVAVVMSRKRRTRRGRRRRGGGKRRRRRNIL
jgi:hypothetical protein